MAGRQVFEVGAGEYEEYRVLAVFDLREDAQAFADHYNLTHLDDIGYGRTFRAVVDGSTLLHYPAGTWRPTSTEVIDGKLVDPRALTQD